MNHYIFNTFPKEYVFKNIINHNNFSFLDFLNEEDYNNYYKLLQSIDEFKLKNIYHHLFLRSIKINKELNSFKILNKIENFLKTEEFDKLLIDYIMNDKVKAITIMNGIDLYFYPNKSIN